MPPPIILHVLDHALPELSGYSIRSHNLLRALCDHGIPVLALAPSAAADRSREETLDGVPYLRSASRSSVGGPLERMIASYCEVHRQLRGRPVALVHAHSPVRTGLPAFSAARRAGVPFVYELRGLWEESAVQRRRMTRRSAAYQLSRLLETWLMRRVDGLTAISHGLIAEAQRRGVAARRIVHVPNGVDAETFRPRLPDAELTARHGLGGSIVFAFIGFFFAYEGVERLVRVWPRVRDRVPNACLLLVGDGDEQPALQAQVRRLGPAANVVMAGQVPHADIPRYYSLADVVVYPRQRARSTELTTPLRPLEAMAMGKPVVASDLGGLREIVQHGRTGLLVAADDDAALAAALTELALDANRRARLGEQARRFAAEERWTRLADVYAATYARLLAPGMRVPGVGA